MLEKSLHKTKWDKKFRACDCILQNPQLNQKNKSNEWWSKIRFYLKLSHSWIFSHDTS